MTDIQSLEITELVLPQNLAEPAAADFLAGVEIARQEQIATWGNDDLSYSPTEFLALTRSPYARHTFLMAKRGGVPLGWIVVVMPLEENLHLARIWLSVTPEARYQGVGKGLLAAAEELSRAEGRSTVVTETSSRIYSIEADAGTLTPRSGNGELPLSNRDVRFAQRAGYSLEQVERFSQLELPGNSTVLQEQLAIAEAAASSDYRLVTWTNRCPDEWVADYAWLQSRMSTDAPHADVDYDEEPWDEKRVREGESVAREQGRTVLVTAVQHLASGKLVAFTILSVPEHKKDAVFQDSTLVTKEHRGHKLGLWVKVANLIRIAQEEPTARRICTWNAAENEHMLAVNIALGFETIAFSGQWQKVLD